MLIVRVNRAVLVDENVIGIVGTTAAKETVIIDYNEFQNAGFSYLSAFQVVPLPANVPVLVHLTSDDQLNAFPRIEKFKGLY